MNSTPSANSQLPLPYPPTRRVEQTDSYHGTLVADPYRWLEDASSSETAAWVKAQNEVTHAFFETLPDRAALLSRLTEMWNYPRFGLPARRGNRFFFSKNDGLQNQAVWLVQNAGEPEASARMLLDPNRLSPDGTVAVAGFAPSDDGSRLAYGLSGAGSDWQLWRVRDVESGQDFPEVLHWIKFSGASWTADGRGFFYARFPAPDDAGEQFQAANLHHKIYYHVAGTPQSQDRLIFGQSDQPEWRMSARVSEEGDLLWISIGQTGPKNRLYYVDLENPQEPRIDGPVIKLIDDFEAQWHFLGRDGDDFYLETDWQAPRGQVVAARFSQPERESFRPLIPEADDTLRDVFLSGNQFVATYLHNAFSQVRFFDLEGQPKGELALPAVGTVGGFSGRRRDAELFYNFTSFVHPPTIFQFDPASGQSEVFRESGAQFSPEGYVSSQEWFESRDGTRIPMFVTHRAGLRRDGSNPTYLTGYGGFSISLTPSFSPTYAMWLEQGGVLAVPSLRGGGEFGESWHEAGTKERKQNVFDDFIGAAEFLIAEGFTSPARLAIAGGSNGGLLVGAVLNQRPELFAAAIPAVGVMDMLRFQKFTIGSAWIYDYGSSDDPEQFAALRAYSPLHNLREGANYPAVLVTTGDHDDRVVPGHSFKYAAALQNAQGAAAPTLIRIETDAGHGAGKPVGKVLEEQSDVWAFVMHHLGVSFDAS